MNPPSDDDSLETESNFGNRSVSGMQHRVSESVNGADDMIQEGLVAPISKTNIEVLEAFYPQSSTSGTHRAPVVLDLKGAVLTEHVQGAKFIKLMEAEAERLQLKPFILGREHGGKSVPTIATESVYVQYFVRQDPEITGSGAEGPRAALGLRKRDREKLEDRVVKLQARVNSKVEGRTQIMGEIEAEEVLQASGAVPTLSAAAVMRLRADANALTQTIDDLEDKLDRAEKECDDFLTYQERQYESNRRLAAERREKDASALRNLHICLHALQAYVKAQLASGFKDVERVCTIYSGGKNPLEVCNMRGVYRNLLRTYRNSSELGIAALTVTRVKAALQGGARTLADQAQDLEALAELYKTVGFIDSKTDYKVLDVIAMIWIAGLTDSVRSKYMAFKQTADITRASVADQMSLSLKTGPLMAADAAEMQAQSAAEKVHLYDEFVAWAKREEEQNVLQGGFLPVKAPAVKPQKAPVQQHCGTG
jgi:hypothetical protein